MLEQKSKGSSLLSDITSDALIDLVIITAVEVERKAVCRAFNLKDKDRVDKGTRRYWRGRLNLKNGQFYEIVVAQLSDMANVDATALTVDALHFWDPAAFLLVGIAGAASDEVALGDLVVASDIYYYERGKVTPTGKRPEPKVYKTDATLWNKVITASEWRTRIPVARPDGTEIRPSIHKGVIASGEKVIAEEAARDDIASVHRKILAIEMEGYGFSAGVFHSSPQRHHLVMKAICDRADRNKGEDWQPYAAAVAAGYAKHFLLDRPLEPRNLPKPEDRSTGEQRFEEIRNRQQRQEKIQQEQQSYLEHVASSIGEVCAEPEVQRSKDLSEHLTPNVPVKVGRRFPLDIPFAGIGSQLEDLINSLSSAVSQEKIRELERIRELYREGRLQEAKQEVWALREDHSWAFLNDHAKANILRVIAIFNLSSGSPDLPEVRVLFKEITKIAPESEDFKIVKVHLIYHDEGPERALAELGEPTSIETLNLNIFLLINANRLDEAINIISNLPNTIPPNTETRRLYAVALMLKGNVDDARIEIQKVMVERPHWEVARTIAAMINYLSVLSPSTYHLRSISWPQPVDWSLIKKDRQSLLLLRAAEEQFARLSVETQRGERERNIFTLWRLACLANDLERQKEASELVQSMLRDDPTDHRALIWALTRNYEVDIASCEKALADVIESSEAIAVGLKAEKILALVGIYLQSDRVLEAIGLLERAKEDFISIENEDLWAFWKGQVYVAHGEPEKALELSGTIADMPTKRSIKTLALRAMCLRSGDWEPLCQHLEESFKDSREGLYLLELCQLKFHFKDWNYIVGRSGLLLETIQTPDAVRLCAIAAWNVPNPEQCLKIIEAYQTIFRGVELPADLLRLQIKCLAITDLAKALASAQDLVRRDQDTENILVLIDVQGKVGDLWGIAVTARELLRRDDVRPQALIRIARLIYLKHAELAKEFWLRAKDRVFEDPDLLSEAIGLGFTLGLDNELAPLFAQAQEFIDKGEGPFQVFNLEQFSSWMKERAEYIDFVNQNYASGKIPLHFLSQATGVTLAEILHSVPEQNRNAVDLRLQPKVFTRHGGRAIWEDFANQVAERRLHLDITSLILAEDLDILSKVEQSFKPLYIPTSLPTALTAQREKLIPHQPSQLPIYKTILDLLERNKLKLIPEGNNSNEYPQLENRMNERWISALTQAKAENGLVVDYLPLTSHDFNRSPIALPEPLQKHITNCRAVLESLKSSGGLSEIAYQQALESLQSEKRKSDQASTPSIGSKLFLIGNIASFLVKADVLSLVTDKFDVYIDAHYVDEARQVIRENLRRTELESWLGRLTDRISEGLVNGTYKVVDISGEDLAKVAEDIDSSDLDFMVVSELLRYRPSERDVIWVDDRCVNSYSSRENVVPIIGINEILFALHLREEITEQEFYSRLLRLRAGNFRYIPISEQEILYHLNQAPIGADGEILETPELSVLRRYYASCLLDTKILQRPPMPEGSPNQTGEMAFIAKFLHAITGAIVGAWADESVGIEVAEARSEWILNNIYTGMFGLIHLLPNPEVRGDGINEMGMDIGGLLGHGITIGRQRLSVEGRSRRQQFFMWFENRVIIPRLRANPNAGVAAAAVVGSMLEQRNDDNEYPEFPEAEKYIRAYKNLYFEDLPESIKDKLNLSPKTLEWLGINMIEAVPLDSFNFSASEYWSAAEKAVNGQSETVRELRSKTAFIFRKSVTDDGSTAVEIVSQEGDFGRRIKDPILGLLSWDVATREEVLRRHRYWFNCEQGVFDKEVKEIIAISDVQERLHRTHDWRNRSAEYFYRNLGEQIAVSKRFLWSDLSPHTPSSLLDHFWLRPQFGESINFNELLLKASDTIITEEGLDAALNRLACLPIRLPRRVVEEYSKRSESEKRALLEKYASEWASPVNRLNLIDLALQSNPNSDDVVQFAKSILADLFTNEADVAFEAFNSVLNFVNVELGYWPDVEGWSAPIKLSMAWAHASRLYNVFSAAGATSRDLMNLFRSVGQPMSTDILMREHALWNDVLHPHILNRVIFLTHGVASVLGGYDQQTLEALSVGEFISNFAFADDANVKVVDLIRDPRLAHDGENSFFGGDRAEVLSPIIGADNVDGLSSSNLEGMVRRSIEELNVDSNKWDWATIDAIVKDQPIYQDLQSRLKDLLLKLEVGSLLETNTTIAHLALRVSANQAVYLGDDNLRAHLEKALLEVTAFGARGDRASQSQAEGEGKKLSPKQEIASLLDAAVTLSIRLNDSRATSRAWGELLRRMSDAWPLIREYMTPTFLRLVFELPASQLHGLWPALLSLRASSAIAL
jgi:nucleoside phosphorylase/tetratricopeptide (TPR) repeat protein